MNNDLAMKLVKMVLENNTSGDSKGEEDNNILWSESIWKYVILRWYDSWVHFWMLEYASKWLYRLSKTRRLWYWDNINWLWLSSVAMNWLSDKSKITCELPLIEITDDKISEIIPCSKKSITNIQKMKEYNPN